MLVLRGISYPPSWGFEGTDLASLAHLECPTVCHGHPVQSFSVPPLSSKLGLSRPVGGFLRNPNKLPLASCANPFTLNLT